MLRASSDATAQELCAHCHEQTQRLDHSLHRNVASAMGSASATNCTPCHSVHDRTPHDGMASVWAMPLGDAAHGASEAQCTGCHATAGPAKAVWYDPHLALPMISPVAESATGFMPLVDAAGRPGMIGKIACVTCHASHGREDSGGFDATAALAGSTDALRLLKPMLRPYVTPNLCSSCHGFDGLQRFLYFHAEDSSRRSPVPVDGQ